jgi:hypothetical protein
MRKNLPSLKRETRKELSYMYITVEQQQGLKHTELKITTVKLLF